MASNTEWKERLQRETRHFQIQSGIPGRLDYSSQRNERIEDSAEHSNFHVFSSFIRASYPEYRCKANSPQANLRSF